MKYPKMSSTLTITHNADGTVSVTDYILEGEYTLSEPEADLLVSLDGKTDPTRICPKMDIRQTETLLSDWEEEHLITRSRVLRVSWLTAIVTLHAPSLDKRDKLSSIGRLVHTLIKWTWFPLLFFAVFCFIKNGIPDSFIEPFWPSYYIGMVVSVLFGSVLHEAGHAMEAKARGCPVYEFGIGIQLLAPFAYVIVGDRYKSNLTKFHICFAGVKMNFFLASIFMCAAYVLPFEGVLFGMATENLIVAVFNLALISSSDGEKMMMHLIGVFNDQMDFEAMSMDMLHSRCIRRMLWKTQNGKISVLLHLTLLLYKLTKPLLMVIFVMEVIGIVTYF